MADTAAHANAADALALAAEVLECARYGEDEDLAVRAAQRLWPCSCRPSVNTAPPGSFGAGACRPDRQALRGGAPTNWGGECGCQMGAACSSRRGKWAFVFCAQKYLGDGVTPDYAGGGGNTPLHMVGATSSSDTALSARPPVHARPGMPIHMGCTGPAACALAPHAVSPSLGTAEVVNPW